MYLENDNLNQFLSAELLEVQALAPAALGIYNVLRAAPNFPQNGEPLQRLKSYLRSFGLTLRVWLLVLQDGDQVLELVRQYYCGEEHESVLDGLFVIHGLGVDRMIPLWLGQAIYGEYGNAGSRKADYFAKMRAVMPKLRHMVRVVQLAIKQPSDKQEMDINQVVHWLTEPRMPALSLQQRQQGWLWLVHQSEAYCAIEDESRAAKGVAWPVPFKILQWGEWELVTMSSTIDLLEEGRLMRNCVGSWSKRCTDAQELLLSVRTFDGKREATLHCKWNSGQWSYVNALGPMNRMLSVTMAQRLQEAVNHLPAINTNGNREFVPDYAPEQGKCDKPNIQTGIQA